jgi:hypothetical protein
MNKLSNLLRDNISNLCEYEGKGSKFNNNILEYAFTNDTDTISVQELVEWLETQNENCGIIFDNQVDLKLYGFIDKHLRFDDKDWTEYQRSMYEMYFSQVSVKTVILYDNQASTFDYSHLLVKCYI